MRGAFLRRALGAAAALLLTGCSMPQSGVDSLLAPPLLNEEQNEIYAALVRETGDSIKLLYPQRGENRSAFLVINLDAEVTSEAVAFYQSTASTVTSAIHMAVLDKRDGAWQSVHDISLEGTQVEDISVMRAGGDSLLAVGLGYSSDNTSLLKIYSFNGSTMDEIYSQSYQTKIISDLNSDDTDDVLLITPVSEDGNSYGRLYTYRNGRFRPDSEVLLDPAFTRYANITDGYLVNGLIEYGVPLFVQASTMLVETIVNAFAGAGTWLLEAGANLVQGFIDGFVGSAQDAANAVLDFGNSIISTFCGVLGIHSPSRVFKQYGQFLMRGLSEGIDENASEPVGSIEAVSDKVAGGFGTEDVSYGDSAAGGLHNAISATNRDGGNGTPMTIIVQSVLDGRVIGETAYNYNRQISRALGV